MRIGIDCRLWNETGVGRYIRNLVLNLQEIDKKNEYVLFVLSKDYNEIISHLSSLTFHLVKADIRWHTIDEQLKLPRILNKENLDLVHFPYFSVPIFYNRPFVVTIHDLIIDHYPTGRASTLSFPVYNLKLLAYKFVLKTAAQKAKKIIAVSNSTKEEIIDHLKVKAEKITVTYEGVDSQISSFKSQVSNPQLKSQKYLLYVGNGYPHKNLERLLEAFEIYKLDQNDIKLVLVGKEDFFYKRLRKKVEKMKLSENVIFKQNATDEELSGLYKNATALILPSLMEGFGLTALEAMANKCLVLCSDIPSLREVCGDAAIYFNPKDSADIAEKLVQALNLKDSERQDLKKKAENWLKKFSWLKMAQQTLAVYEQAVK